MQSLILILALLVSACSPVAPASPEDVISDESSSEDDDSVAESLLESSVVIRIGTHEIGAETIATFLPLDEGSSVPIVYGPQGAYMVIISLELVDWKETKATISLSTIFEDEVVASLYYPDYPLAQTTDGAYASNLFMLTNNWPEYAATPLILEVSVSGEYGQTQTNLGLSFTSPRMIF